MQKESAKYVEERFILGEEYFAQTFGHNVGIGKYVKEYGAGSDIGLK